MKQCVAWLLLVLANVGCASERLYVKVTDDEGHPVTNATVKVGFSSSNLLFDGGRRSRGSHGGHAAAKTDGTGNAIVEFNCTSSDFGWQVEADGYYPSEIHMESFKGEDVAIPPVFVKVILHEHEKHGNVTLYRKKNPQPMYAYSRQMKVETPIENGRYGFDLQCFDWLPPRGKGKVADFYYVRERKDVERVNRLIAQKNDYRVRVFHSDEPGAPRLGEVVGRMEFDQGCGAYVRKQTGNDNFPATHGADLSTRYLSSLPIMIRENNGKTWLQEGPVIKSDEYMVIRSRVKCDEQGNVVSANYSKLIGPVGFGSTVGIFQSVFNPRPNDTNLEFDPSRNLYQGKKGRGMIP